MELTRLEPIIGSYNYNTLTSQKEDERKMSAKKTNLLILCF